MNQGQQAPPAQAQPAAATMPPALLAPQPLPPAGPAPPAPAFSTTPTPGQRRQSYTTKQCRRLKVNSMEKPTTWLFSSQAYAIVLAGSIGNSSSPCQSTREQQEICSLTTGGFPRKHEDPCVDLRQHSHEGCTG